jgi:hypothetical protein
MAIAAPANIEHVRTRMIFSSQIAQQSNDKACVATAARGEYQ